MMSWVVGDLCGGPHRFRDQAPGMAVEFVRSAAGAGIAAAAPRPEIQEHGLAITLVLVTLGQETANQQSDANKQSQSRYD